MKSKVATPKRAARRGSSRKALADDACPTCGTLMTERRGKLRLPVNGEEITVPGASHLACPKCHEIILRAQDARRLSEDAVATYRQKHDLLSGDQIRDIRRRHKLTQAHFARLLRLGGNTLSRWESGRNVQTEAMDTLLRLIRDFSGALDYLRRQRRPKYRIVHTQ